MSDDGVKTHTNHSQPQPVHNMEDLQSELERVSSAMMSTAPPAVPVTRVESNDDGDGPSTADDPSSFITLMPPSSARPIVIPPPNFPVEAGELTVSPSTVRISSDEQSGMAGLGEMTLRIGVPAPPNTSVIVERPPEPPAKFMNAEVPEPAVESPSVEEEEAVVEEASVEEQNVSGRAGSERYICNDCGKTFLYKLSWINHKLTHAGVAPFECKKCGKTFAYNSSVYNHMKIPGRCKGYKKTREKRASASKEAPEDKSEVESSEEEAVASPPQDRETRQDNRGQKLKPVAAVAPERKSSGSSKTLPVPAEPVPPELDQTVEIVTPVVVPRKRGRPPKYPKPATAVTPTATTPSPSTSTPKPAKSVPPKKVSEEKVSTVDKRRESDMHRSRSQRRIQPPMWMRNMEMDYEIPVTHGIFQGDNSRPMSTGANWREVNSMTNDKRRKSSGDSASDEDYPALQRQDTDNDGACNGSNSAVEATGNEVTLPAENANISENGSLDETRGSSLDSNVTEVVATTEEVRIPKKRGRKKKVVVEAQKAEQSKVVPDTPANEKNVPSPTTSNFQAVAHTSVVVSPTKRNLRGLPHRSEAVAETPAEVQKTPSPAKKLKIEVEDVEEESNAALPLEDDVGEEQAEDIEMEEEEEIEEEEEEEQMEDDSLVDEEEEEEEEQRQGEERRIQVDTEDGEGSGTTTSIGMEPMNEDEDEVYQEEEEEEDTDVVEGSDNEQPPRPPQENAPQPDAAVPTIQVAPGPSSSMATVSAPAGEFDLKTAAITFLSKKISNRNMHRIRRELMELTDHGDYFQLTQWAPLAAGFLQAMLLRNFSKE